MQQSAKDQTLPIWFIMATTMICGAMVMVVEVLGSRVIGPFFGVSLFVWSSLISVAMISLAIGYYGGGIFCDKNSSPKYLYRIILAAGILVLLIPVIRGPIIKMCIPLDLRLGTFVCSLLLFAPPLILLGAVSPFVVRLAALEMGKLGRTVGGFYAISTLGSVAGTLLTGFVLIIYLGVTKIFILVGLVLIALAVFYFVYIGKKYICLLLLIAPLVAYQCAGERLRSATLAGGTVAQVVENLDGHYGNIKVVEYRYSNRGIREMLVDGCVQTGIDMQTGQSVYPYPYLLSIIPFNMNPAGKRALVIGLGGGVIPTWYEAQGVKTDVVDIDPHVVSYARQYFGFKSSGTVNIEDARTYLAQTREMYDFIVIDVFTSDAAPSHIISTEALALVKARLNSGGVLALNFIGRSGGDDFVVKSVLKTLRVHFANIEIFPCFDPAQPGIGNQEIICYNEPRKKLHENPVKQFAIHPSTRAEVEQAYAWRRVVESEEAGIILTDEYNPFDCYDAAAARFARNWILKDTPFEILL